MAAEPYFSSKAIYSGVSPLKKIAPTFEPRFGGEELLTKKTNVHWPTQMALDEQKPQSLPLCVFFLNGQLRAKLASIPAVPPALFGNALFLLSAILFLLSAKALKFDHQIFTFV